MSKNALELYKDFIDKIDIKSFKKVANNLNYKIYDKGNYNLNIWGIRCDIKNTKEFNDLLVVFYKSNDYNDKLNGSWKYDWYSITTDPSNLNLISPINNKGCAILKEGQFERAFKLGKHKGEYDALVQNKPLPLYRDNNKDDILDITGKYNYEMAGINIHRASKWKIIRTIGLYSAGCQVFESVTEFENKFIPVVKKSIDLYGNAITYTLINIKDLKNIYEYNN